MRVPRLFVDAALHPSQRLTLPPQPAHYLTRVLRLRSGAQLVVFDGRGGQYPARVVVLERNAVQVEVGERESPERESPLAITLAQGVSRSERMDYTVQKAIELGVRTIQPLLSERCTVAIEARRQDRRLSHWRGIAISACEQCGRNRLPEIHPVASLDDFLHRQEGDTRLLLDPSASAGLTHLPRPPHGVTLLVGPEGGLSDGERERSRAAGYTAVRLGPRVLRTETAAVAALTALQVLWGDLG